MKLNATWKFQTVYTDFLFLQGVDMQMYTLELYWALRNIVKCPVSAFLVLFLNSQKTYSISCCRKLQISIYRIFTHFYYMVKISPLLFLSNRNTLNTKMISQINTTLLSSSSSPKFVLYYSCFLFQVPCLLKIGSKLFLSIRNLAKFIYQ